MNTKLDMQQIMDYMKNALEAISALVTVGGDVLPLIEVTKERLDAMAAAGRGPTPEEWDAQNQIITDLNNRLNSDDT